MSPDSTVHGATESSRPICRHPRYGWYIMGGAYLPMEEVTVRRAAIEALRGRRVILGVPGGSVFDRTVRQLGTDPDFGESSGLTAWDAAETFWRSTTGPAECTRLDDCWLVDSPGDRTASGAIHVTQETGLVHEPAMCEAPERSVSRT